MINHHSFRKIFKQSTIPALILLPDSPVFTISEATESFLKMTGKCETELIGKGFFEIFLQPSDQSEPEDYALFHSMNMAITSGNVQKVNTIRFDTKKLPTAAVEERYWDVENNPVRNDDGKVEYIIMTGFEVTEKVMNEIESEFVAEQFEMSDEVFRKLIRNGSEIINILDAEGKYLYVSPSIYSVLGYVPADFLGKSAFDFIHPDDRDILHRNLLKIGEVKRLKVLPFRFMHKDGSWRWLETIASDMLDVPSVKGIVTNSRDITENMLAQEEVKASEIKYRSLFQYSPTPKWVYDLETYQILDVNDSAILHYGYSREEFLNLTVKCIRPKEEVGKLLEATENIQDRRGLIDFGVFTHIKKDKTRIKVHVSGYSYSSQEKNCLMVDCFDITERENSYQLIKENESKLLAAVSIARLGYWKLNIRTSEIFWSDEVYKIWGITKGSVDLNFETFLSFIHPEDVESFMNEQSLSLAGKKDHDIEHRIIRPDGTIKWVQEKGNLVLDDSGKPLSFEGTVRDITEEKLLELSLEESNLRYDYVLKATFDAIWDWDIQSDICMWGEGFTTIFGYNLEGRQSANFWSQNIHPEDHSTVWHGMQEAIKGNVQNWEKQYRFRKADGSYAHVLDRALIIRDKNGKAIRMVGALQDISEKIILEQLLDKANRLAKIGSWEIDVLKGTVYWSDITKDIREASPDFLPTLQHGLGNFKDGKDKQIITQKVQECIDHGTSWEEDLQIITEKGNLKWIRTIGKAELVNGKCVKIFGSFQDIDATKKAEIEIRKLYTEKNTILESIGDAFFAIDTNWIVTYWNKEAEKMLGVPKSEILGKFIWDIFSDSVGSESYNRYHESLRTNKALNFEDYYAVLDKWFEVSCYPLENGLSVYFKDVTERKLSDIELKKLNEDLHTKARELAISNSELEQFAYIASHDLQEPLRMVTSFLNHLQKKYSDVIDETGKQYIYYAVDGATRMKQIILDLLQYSRVGRFGGESEIVDLNEVVKQIILLHKNQVEETNATITFKELPVIKSYRSPLRQIFQNILSNALKYHKKGVPLRVNISADESETHWLFSIKDNGIGIKPEHFERIFVLFQRLHSKEAYGGTGIGLAIVKKIVDAFGGEIQVASEEGKGSCFSFSIKK
jgi:PAS domain S-box-containing protein